MARGRLLAIVLILTGCDVGGTVRIVSPQWCPVSDSAWAKVDSVPAICVLAKDSTP